MKSTVLLKKMYPTLIRLKTTTNFEVSLERRIFRKHKQG